MIFLVNRIETFLERAEESQCHNMAVRAVIDTAKKELARPEISSTTRPNSTASRRLSGPQTNHRVRNSRRSSGAYDEDVAPEQQLARHLGVALPADELSDHERATLLERALSERTARLEGHASSLQSTTESSISSHLLDARLTLELLRDALLAESRYGKVRLLDPQLEASVDRLEREVLDVQEGLERVDLHSLQARNVRREQLVKRWSVC